MKAPVVARESVPWVGPTTTAAVRVAESTSVSPIRTPLAAATTSGTSSLTGYASGSLTGASLTGVTVSDTVPAAEKAAPSKTR